MATVFTLLSLRALLKWDGRARTYAAAVVWFTLAVYSKISAVPFAAAVFFVFMLVMRLPSLRAARLTTGFAIVALVFMIHRHLVIGQSNQTAPISGTYAQTLVDMLPVAPKYLRLLLGVPPFCIDYSYMKGHSPLFSAPVLLGVATLLIGTWLGIMFLRNRATCLAGVGLLWLGLFLLPVSNLLPMMQYMAERFLYLPLIGFLWSISVLFREVIRPKLALAISVAAITVWAALAWDRSWIWQDELTLFMQSHQAGPYTPRVAENARRAVFKLPHIRSMFTLDEKKQVLKISASARTDNAERIERTLLQAAELFPDDEHIATALGILYGTTGQHQKAVPQLRIATARRPDNPRYWANLGHACLETRAFDEAEQALHQAVTLSPNNVDALRSLSRLYWLRQQYGESTKVLQTLQQLEPANTEYAQWIQQAEKLAARDSASPR
jgi:tetratricopeptide (TPR) repeat protein